MFFTFLPLLSLDVNVLWYLMKLAKTVQLDISDTKIFETPANVGEWALAGTFTFVDSNPNDWSNKQKLCFETAWLGVGSFGYSTFVQTTNIYPSEYEQLLDTVTRHLTQKYGAPNQNEAKKAAKLEIDDMTTLCEHPPGTLLAIERTFSGDNIVERTRIVSPGTELLKPII